MIIPDDLSGIPDGDGSWSIDTNRLLKAVEEENLELLNALLAKGASVNGHGGVFHETPLHKAAQQGWVAGVQRLLAHGATVNSKNQFGQTPLHYASASKSCDCVRILLDSGSHATLDHRDVRGHTPLHDAAAVGHPDGVKLLLKAGANVTVRDNKNEETPLHKSAKARCVESMVALLNKGADMGTRDKTGESVLSYVLRHLPAGMEALLDECLITNADKLTSKKLEVSFNFVPLAGSSEMNQMKILSNVVDLGHPKLLLHPVCEAFLLLKWHNVRKLFFIEVIFYFVHAILATLLILDKFVWRGVDGTYPENIPYKAYDVLEIILLLMAVIILLKQVLTIIQSVRTWIFSLWHVLNGVIPVLVILVVPGNASLWQHHFATATLLLIWAQCMLHIGRFPGCGIYVAMFTRVAKVFVRIFLIFFCLLLAFSMSFYVSKFGNQYNMTSGEEGKMEVKDMVYSNPILTFIKTLTMMIGELDFDSSFVTQLGHLDGTSHIIYFAFVILVSIILSNLLVALAVNDVQGLRNSAHLERLIKQMELVFQMEKTFGSVLSLAYIINFSWLHQKIKLFVHDFSKTRVFLQPFHPQKGSKLMLAEKGIIREINLHQNHVSKVMDCLRLRQEEASATSNRKLSDRKSLQVRGEYSSFGGSGDEIRDLLKAVERNLLATLSEKIDDAMVPLASLSHRVRALEEMCSTEGDGERKTSAPVESSAHSGPQISRISNHVVHPSSMRVHSRRPQVASSTHSLRQHAFRLPQQSASHKLQHHLSQPPLQTAPSIATQPINESTIQETQFVSREAPEQTQQEPRVLQQQSKSEIKDGSLRIQLETLPPQRSTSLPEGSVAEVSFSDTNHVPPDGNQTLENG